MIQPLTSGVSFLIYRYFLIPLAVISLRMLRPFLSGKLRLMVDERIETRWPELPSRPVWIHASSGEIEYAKPLIRALKERWPQRMILITYFSPSAKKLIKSMSGIDAIVPLPWDEKYSVHKFLQHFRPQISLIARTDVWPEFAFQCRKKGIPVILFSATMATQSRRNGILSSPLTRFAFNQLKLIACVSNEDISEIAKIGSDVECKVLGDTRYDQVLWRIENPTAPKTLKENFGRINRPTFVIGSSWPQDEHVLFSLFSDFIRTGGRVILAPHETSQNRIRQIQDQLKDLAVKTKLYSTEGRWNDDDVLLVDQVGHLQELYTWGDLAFVGGSFKDKVHSVMEPLAAGLPTLVGPFHTNNREALQFQNYFLKNSPLSMVSVVKHRDEVRTHLERLLTQHEKWPEFKRQIHSKVEEKAGATAKLLDQIEALSQ